MIEHHRVVAFGRNLSMTPQTGEFKLQNVVECDLNFAEPGKYFTDELIGGSDPEDVEDRYGDTPDGEPDRHRRVAFFRAYHDAKWLGDQLDRARQMSDPANAIVVAMRYGKYRKQDRTILHGLFAPAREGESGETIVPFPNDNILSNNGKLSLDKLHKHSKAHDNGKIPGEERFWIGGASDKDNLLKTTEVRSSDYNAVKALVQGEIDTFMGFKFIWFADDEIPIIGGKRRNISLKKTGNQYKARPIVGGENANIRQRYDKQDNWQAYYKADHAFLRRYDNSVYVDDCDDT